MAIPYPCVDAGYIFDPGMKLDMLMSDFYEAENSQSYLFNGSITSFPQILQTYQSNPAVVVNRTQDALSNILGKYFDNVDVHVNAVESNSATSYNLRMTLKVVDGLETVNFYTQLKVSGTQFEKTLQTRS